MKGNNSLNFNTATMLDALQHYFDTVIFAEGHSPKVTSISSNTKQYGVESFDIGISDPTTEGDK